jgi:tRNA (adenine22-N1)-methyltransferase
MTQRLQALFSYCKRDLEIWDIGCDHGFIGKQALLENWPHKIHFVDQSKAVTRVLESELNQIQLPAKSAGFEILTQNGAQLNIKSGNVIIAGMGGHTMIEILDSLLLNLHAKKSLRFILCPNDHVISVREFLNTKLLGLFAEQLVKERGRIRQILVIEAEGHEIDLLGERLENDPHFSDYLANLKRTFLTSQVWRRKNPDLFSRMSEFVGMHESR